MNDYSQFVNATDPTRLTLCTPAGTELFKIGLVYDFSFNPLTWTIFSPPSVPNLMNAFSDCEIL
jgi:hypothetical protein